MPFEITRGPFSERGEVGVWKKDRCSLVRNICVVWTLLLETVQTDITQDAGRWEVLYRIEIGCFFLDWALPEPWELSG